MGLFGFGNSNKRIREPLSKKELYAGYNYPENIEEHLINTFGTSDLDAVIKYGFSKAAKCGGGSSDPYNIEEHLINTFGTPDLDAVFSLFMSLGTREKLEKKLKERPEAIKNKTTEYAR